MSDSLLWGRDILAIIAIAIVLSWTFKGLCNKLSDYFYRHQGIVHASLYKALCWPLFVLIWWIALVAGLWFTIYHFSVNLPYSSLYQIFIVPTVLIASWFLMRWKRELLALALVKSQHHEIKLDPTRLDALGKLGTLVIFFVTVILLLEVTDRSMSTLITFGGIGGLAIAFASKEMMSNYFGGLMIYITRPFGVGDWIHIRKNDVEGIVEEIGWYLTRVRTFEKRPIYIPNSIFATAVVETPSRMSHRLFKESIGLRYVDAPAVKNVVTSIYKMLKEYPNVDQQQTIGVYLDHFGEYALEIRVSAYTITIDGSEFAAVKQDLRMTILDILDKNQAQLASPTHLLEIPEGHKLS